MSLLHSPPLPRRLLFQSHLLLFLLLRLLPLLLPVLLTLQLLALLPLLLLLSEHQSLLPTPSRRFQPIPPFQLPLLRLSLLDMLRPL